MIEYPKYKKVVFCTDFSKNADYAFEFLPMVLPKEMKVFSIFCM